MSRLVAVARRLSECGLLLVGLLVALVGVPHAGAQVVGGTILGTINDPSGAVIPHAQVSIRNLENGATRTVDTDAAGFYAVPNLQPAKYEVKASAAGFTADAKTDIESTVGNQQLLNFTLDVRQVSESVEVNTVPLN